MKRLILMIIILFANTEAVFTETLRVGQGQDYADIQSAVDDSGKNDVIVIHEDVYLITTPIRISNKFNLILKAEGVPEIAVVSWGDPVLAVDRCQDVTVQNLVIGNASGYADHNIRVRDSVRINLVGCEIFGKSLFAVSASNTYRLSVLTNLLRDYQIGAVEMYSDCKKSAISENEYAGSGDDILINY